MPGCLYVVATPIGNLEDITLRALDTLKSADLILCEDTRHTRHLLDHFGIVKPLLSYHDHNEKERSVEVAAKVEEGKSVALVSDAGTPLVADPGYRVVRAVVDRGLPVVPIPGASAILAGLSVAGLATDTFFFGGFLPRKPNARRKVLGEWKELGATLVFYEAPHRALESLADVEQIFGDPELVVCRELTKRHEEILRGRCSVVRANLASRPQILGEFTVLVGKGQARQDAEDPVASVRALEEGGMARMVAIKEVARRTGRPKRDIYRAVEDQDS